MWRFWRRRKDDYNTASAVASYAYCPEQWRLEIVLGLKPANRASLKAGTRHHARKALPNGWRAGLSPSVGC